MKNTYITLISITLGILTNTAITTIKNEEIINYLKQNGYNIIQIINKIYLSWAQVITTIILIIIWILFFTAINIIKTDLSKDKPANKE